MEFLRKAIGQPSRLAVFPASFNPPTIAHLALAHAALPHVDEVVFVLPRVFPHKNYSGACFQDRVEMVRVIAGESPRFSAAISEGGLFLEIARECRAEYGSRVALSFLCGRDAAERIVGWDYGRPDVAAEMLRDFSLLVAPRGGAYCAPPDHAHAVKALDVAGCEVVSATEVRDRIARGGRWEELVPQSIRLDVARIYGPYSRE